MAIFVHEYDTQFKKMIRFHVREITKFLTVRRKKNPIRVGQKPLHPMQPLEANRRNDVCQALYFKTNLAGKIFRRTEGFFWQERNKKTEKKIDQV